MTTTSEMMTNSERVRGSFRDPSGFLFSRDGILYRQVNEIYREDYTALMESGLYDKLSGAGLLVSHEEVDQEPEEPEGAYKVIRPAVVPFISYPYEWSFGQLKKAALATLHIQKQAMKFGLSLKDASAYNIQFRGRMPVLIDSLSFEIYQEGRPWVPYRQFCQHFLAPLALMSHTDIRLGQLLREYIDGIPLDLASRLLPGRTRLNFGLLTHLHLHAAAQKRYADRPVDEAARNRQMSRTSLQGLLEGLEGAVRKLKWKPAGTEWGDYYTASAGHYSEETLADKQRLVSAYLERARPNNVWDLGANTGFFSRLASSQGIHTVAFDIDPAAVEQNYRRTVKEKEDNLLPLLQDLINPTPAIGWNSAERMSLKERGPVEAVLALALIHHLAISNNVPLP
ncbi:MAG: hypothetical protein R3335_04290, partial [Anaerolineales bacterium]|nr:hypothetical protein [Anaerolineales bacterium]